MHRLFFAAFAVLSFAAAAHAEHPALSKIEPEYHIHARAESLAALKTKTKPILVYDETEFIWTTRNEGDERNFQIASARRYIHNGKTEWVIIESGEGIDGLDDPHEGYKLDMAVGYKDERLYGANVISQHPKFGTLYRIRIDRADQSLVNYTDEERILFMHDPEHGWRFVARIDGANAMKRTSTTLDMKIAWTGKPDQPLALAIDRLTTITPPGKDETPISYHDTCSMSGALPLKQTGGQTYIAVAKGDTLSALASGIARWESWMDSRSVTPAEVRKRILKLNPGLNPDVLRAGAKLNVLLD